MIRADKTTDGLTLEGLNGDKSEAGHLLPIMFFILIPLHVVSYTKYNSLAFKLGAYSCQGVDEWANINASVDAPNEM